MAEKRNADGVFFKTACERNRCRTGIYGHNGEEFGYVSTTGDYLETLYVTNIHRCRGYGSRLLEHVTRRMKEQGYKQCGLLACGIANIPTSRIIEFYEKRGFVHYGFQLPQSIRSMPYFPTTLWTFINKGLNRMTHNNIMYKDL